MSARRCWSSSSPNLLGRLRFDDEVLDWVREALHASHADERREHEEAIKRLRAEHKRLGERISAMYIDKLDGKIGGEFYDKIAERMARGADSACSARSTGTRRPSSPTWTRASRFSNSRGTPKACSSGRNRAKNVACSISYYRTAFGRMVRSVATFRQPFDLLAETTAIAACHEAKETADLAKSEIWLPGPDSNQRPSG